MIGEAVLLVAMALTTPAPISGLATFYNPGVMERVYEYRLAVGDVAPCPECVGMVALLDAEHIGEKVWLVHPGGEVVGPVHVIDCAQEDHRAALIERGWVADLGWPLAERWGMRGPLDMVRVEWREP